MSVARADPELVTKEVPVQVWVAVGTLHGCSSSLLNDPEELGRILTNCTQAAGLTLLHQHVHQFSPQGVTASAVLAESHIAIHTWPERGVLFVDIATCSSKSATRAALDELCSHIPHIEKRFRAITAE